MSNHRPGDSGSTNCANAVSRRSVAAISHDAEDKEASPEGAAVVLAPAAAGPLDASLTDIRAGDPTRDSAHEMGVSVANAKVLQHRALRLAAQISEGGR